MHGISLLRLQATHLYRTYYSDWSGKWTASPACIKVIHRSQFNAVLSRPLPTSLRRRFSAASQVGQSTTPGTSASPDAKVWPTGFLLAGPSAWNSLPGNLGDPSVTRDSFRRLLKIHLFALYWSIQRIRGFTKMRYKSTTYFNYLLMSYHLICDC